MTQTTDSNPPSSKVDQSRPAARYLVGIDLGTTHTVVSYAPLSDQMQPAQRQIFEIEQLVAPGEVAKLPLLPSFRYHPAPGELAEADLVLPWSQDASPAHFEDLPRRVIGAWARSLGAKADGRLVVSAKSWLSHPQVDRRAAILPWSAATEADKVSPLIASASYLHYVRQAWNHEHPDALLEDQEIVVTVPASFDEGARVLTVEAATLAGLPHILLLEEPLAVCYDWFARHQANAAQLLNDLRLLLVCDVGGGTTDLSLVKIALDEQQQLNLTRIGVGDHLMLGGDNIDLALAHLAEQRLAPGKPLSAGQLSQLIQQTRQAKERLLQETAPTQATVTLLGSGARLIGGAKSCELTRDEVQAIALDGFFPLSDFAQRPNKRRSAVVEFGLPYASDPAISKHLAAFIGNHERACREALDDHNALNADADSAPAIPDALLLNGGVFNSGQLNQRLQDLLAQWRQGQPVTCLDNPHPDLAVAYGAVAYAMARRGQQLKIGGGSARSFFLVLPGAEGERAQTVCLLPKGTEELCEVALTDRQFLLTLDQPVIFNLTSTTRDQSYLPGELATLADDFIALPPLIAALPPQSGNTTNKGSARQVPVQLMASLTEVGTLQLQCVSIAADQPAQRWQVEFQVRQTGTAECATDDGSTHGATHSTTNRLALPPRWPEAQTLLDALYGEKKQKSDPKLIKTLRNDLEKCLGKRDTWDANLLRTLFDQLLQGQAQRRRSQQHERLWLNLAGFGLRPGFGHPADAWRLQKIWPLYEQGLAFPQETQSWIDWWTFWRRAAGGLNADQQARIYTDLAVYIDPANIGSRKLQAEAKQHSYEDMVRLLGSLELLPVSAKIAIGDGLLTRLQNSSETQTSWWALGRLASRIPFHASLHQVIPRQQVETWLTRVLQENWQRSPNLAFAAILMCRLSGDRERDLDERLRQQVIERLQAVKTPALWLRMLTQTEPDDAAQTKLIFGEALPAGLTLIESSD
ncbi:MAG: hsp70 family protein [Hahellaceae bacterium]|nr:hsp70 family protein [Hahellaceae bacterium]